MGYQYKLDFGEGPDCHRAYEAFLEVNDLPDTDNNWALFTECWKQILQMEAMAEKEGKPIQ